jgi:integrase
MSLKEESKKMAGTIVKRSRKTAKGQERYAICLSWRGKKHWIYSDKKGVPLASETQTLYLQHDLDVEIANHTFDPANYVKAEVARYRYEILLENFLEDKRREIAPSYQANYKRMVEEAQEFFQDKDVRELRKVDLLDYLKHLRNKGIGEKTQKNYLDLLRVFVSWCRDRDIKVDGIVSWPKVEVPEPKWQWLDQEAQQKILDAVPTNDHMAYMALMLMGIRPGELRALKVKDVNPGTQTVTISATFSGNVYRERRKGRRAKAVTVPIHPLLVTHIDDRVKNYLPEAWLFPNPRTGRPYNQHALTRRWKATLEKLGAQKVRLYDGTRHSFASQLINEGVPQDQVRDLMGHSTSKMTERYAHRNASALRSPLEKLWLSKVCPIDVKAKKLA